MSTSLLLVPYFVWNDSHYSDACYIQDYFQFFGEIIENIYLIVLEYSTVDLKLSAHDQLGFIVYIRS